MVLVVKDKEYKIKYAYEPTLKQKILSKLHTVTKKMNGQNEEDSLVSIEDLLLFVPELLLVGLQKCNQDFKYDYDTNEGKEEQLNKIYNILEDYTEDKNNDLMQLFNDLQEELLNDSFLSAMFRKEQETIEKVENAIVKQIQEN